MRDLGTVTISIDSKDVVITWAPWPLLPCSVLYVCSLFSLFPLFSQTLLTVLDLIHIATLKMSFFDGARGHESRGEVRLLGGMCGGGRSLTVPFAQLQSCAFHLWP